MNATFCEPPMMRTCASYGKAIVVARNKAAAPHQRTSLTTLSLVCPPPPRSAFNPPVAGTEDHDKSGVYPAVDDAGVQHYHIEPHVLPSLVKPPVAIAKGTLPLMPKPAAPAAPSPITCSPPERSDGKAMWELANSTTTLDTNSPYAYMTFAAHFASECLGIAQGEGITTPRTARSLHSTY